MGTVEGSRCLGRVVGLDYRTSKVLKVPTHSTCDRRIFVADQNSLFVDGAHTIDQNARRGNEIAGKGQMPI